MILTVDLGSTAVKAVAWDPDGPVGLGRVTLTTERPTLGWAEQDAETWWAGTVAAVADALDNTGRHGAVEAICCTGARQTFVPADASTRPLGPGLVWSDRRAGDEAVRLGASVGGTDRARARTGIPLDAGSVAAKVAWLARHRAGGLTDARWLLGPRDLVVARLTGEVRTDVTMASRTGLYDLDGRPVEELVGAAAGLLPPVESSDHVAGGLRESAARDLGLAAGLPVIVGAGDRACEALGAGASPQSPMVSWGTTASVVIPVVRSPVEAPPALALTRSADGGWLLEGGLSAAGSLLSWLGELTGRDVGELMRAAADSPAGSRGVVAVPWLDGARAPWWQGSARAGFVGLGAAHNLADLARAAVESVAADVQRCLAACPIDEGGLPVGQLVLAGHGSSDARWAGILSAVTGLPVTGRHSPEAASAGAALLAAGALGLGWSADTLNPAGTAHEPSAEEVERYRSWLAVADRVAQTLVTLELEVGGQPGPDSEYPRTGDGAGAGDGALSRRAWPVRRGGHPGA